MQISCASFWLINSREKASWFRRWVKLYEKLHFNKCYSYMFPNIDWIQCSYQWAYIEVTFVSANTTTESVTRHCSIRSTRSQFSAGIQSMSQPAASVTRSHPGMVHGTQAPVSRPGYGNLQDLGEHCCLASCEDWPTNLTAMFGRTYE